MQSCPDILILTVRENGFFCCYKHDWSVEVPGTEEFIFGPV